MFSVGRKLFEQYFSTLVLRIVVRMVLSRLFISGIIPEINFISLDFNGRQFLISEKESFVGMKLEMVCILHCTS